MSKLDSANRNLLINGGFSLFQRSPVAVVNLSTSMAYVSPDRFRVGYTGTVTGTPTCGPSTNVPTNGKSSNSLALTAQRNASTLDLAVAQRVESMTAVECSSEIVSFSCQYVSPIATQATLTIRTPNTADNYSGSNVVYQQTVSLVNSASFNIAKFEGITLPNVSNGFEVEWKFNLPSGTDASPVVHYITQIKLNVGRKALGFTRSGTDISSEIEKCQRFYEKSYKLEVSPATIDSFGIASTLANSTGSIDTSVPFKVTKRVVPTVVSYSPVTGASGVYADIQGGVDRTSSGGITPSTSSVRFSNATGHSASGRNIIHWTADSEI